MRKLSLALIAAFSLAGFAGIAHADCAGHGVQTTEVEPPLQPTIETTTVTPAEESSDTPG